VSLFYGCQESRSRVNNSVEYADPKMISIVFHRVVVVRDSSIVAEERGA